MTQATAATWGQSFQYDGFGNLTGQTGTGTAPSFTGSIAANTNRRTDAGYQYDLNGNATNMPGGTTYSYDGANRLVSNGAAYDLGNRRVWGGSQIYYYAPNGQLLAKYSPQFGGSSTMVRTSVSVWFGRKLIRETQPGLSTHQRWVMTDRLGSVRVDGDGERSNYYPYGQEIQATSNGRTKFGTYYRDTPGLDYADQRYYANASARFLTPDPSRGSSSGDPGRWNKYAYVGGDPVNFNDPSGRNRLMCDVYTDYGCAGSGNNGTPGVGWYMYTTYGPEGSSGGGGFFPGSPGGGGDPIGGSGGETPDPVQRVTSASGALTALKATINDLGVGCAKVLPGADVLLKDAGQLSFADARASADGNKTVAQIAPTLAAYNSAGTLQSIVGGANAVTLNGANNSISNTVLLGNQFFLDEVYGNNANFSVGQTAVLLHELLHYATQLGDNAFVSKYGIQPQQYESSSSAINRWLQNDCKN